MRVNINRKNILCFIEIMASYIAIVTLVLVVLHEKSLQWKLFTEHYVSFSILCFILFASFGSLLYSRCSSFLLIFKTNAFRYTTLLIAIAAGIYFKFHVVEFIIFLYAVYVIIFINQSPDENRLYQSIHKLTDRLLTVLFTVESRTPALFTLLLFLLLPLLVIAKKTTIAVDLAVYSYYLLVIAVVLQIIEVKLGIERKSYLLAMLKDLLNAIYRAVVDKDLLKRSCISVRGYFRIIFTKNKVTYLAVLTVLFALIYIAKHMY